MPQDSPASGQATNVETAVGSSAANRRPPTYPVAPVRRVRLPASATWHGPSTAEASIDPDDLSTALKRFSGGPDGSECRVQILSDGLPRLASRHDQDLVSARSEKAGQF